MRAVGIYLLGYATLSMAVCAIAGVIERAEYANVMDMLFWPVLVILFGALWSRAWAGARGAVSR